jgi:hypothetical protein
MVSPFKLIKNKISQKKCIKISVSNKSLIRYLSNSKKNQYQLLFNQFDYVNRIILNHILNEYKI